MGEDLRRRLDEIGDHPKTRLAKQMLEDAEKAADERLDESAAERGPARVEISEDLRRDQEAAVDPPLDAG
jgi:hypothetical protein